jgi:hypothetical protein
VADTVVPALSRVARETSVGSGGAALVAVMQSADLTRRHNVPRCGRLNRSWIGGVFPQRQMGSGSVVIINIRRKYSPQ